MIWKWKMVCKHSGFDAFDFAACTHNEDTANNTNNTCNYGDLSQREITVRITAVVEMNQKTTVVRARPVVLCGGTWNLDRQRKRMKTKCLKRLFIGPPIRGDGAGERERGTQVVPKTLYGGEKNILKII